MQFRFGFAAILRYVLLALLGGAAVDSHTVLWCILPNLLRLRNLLVRALGLFGLNRRARSHGHTESQSCVRECPRGLKAHWLTGTDA